MGEEDTMGSHRMAHHMAADHTTAHTATAHTTAHTATAYTTAHTVTTRTETITTTCIKGTRVCRFTRCSRTSSPSHLVLSSTTWRTSSKMAPNAAALPMMKNMSQSARKVPDLLSPHASRTTSAIGVQERLRNVLLRTRLCSKSALAWNATTITLSLANISTELARVMNLRTCDIY